MSSLNLIVDIGNSLIKTAVFRSGELLAKEMALQRDFKEVIDRMLERFPTVEQVALSAVGELTEARRRYLHKIAPVFEVSHSMKLPFHNRYTTPTTLGVDRLALVSAAIKHYAGQPVLIIDCGTCVTYDFLDCDQNYWGGAISPGLGLRYKALNAYTHKLPLLDINTPKDLVGDSTTNAIHAGVVLGICSEIDGMVGRYQERHSGLTIILTGGDAHFLREYIKSTIFANANFLLEGLDFLLEHNKLD